MYVPKDHINRAQDLLLKTYQSQQVEYITFCQGYLCLGRLSYVFKVKFSTEEHEHFALVTGFKSFAPNEHAKIYADVGVYDELSVKTFIKYLGRRLKTINAEQLASELNSIDPKWHFSFYQLDYPKIDPYATSFFEKCMRAVNPANSLVGFILLEHSVLSAELVVNAMKDTWGLDFKAQDSAQVNLGEHSVTIDFNDICATITLSDEPLDQELTTHAANLNYMWPEGESIVAKHQALLCITMSSSRNKKREFATPFVMLMAALSTLPECLGVLYRAFMFEPQFYRTQALLIHDDHIPVSNLVWKHLEQGIGESVNAYTVGLGAFGKYELEFHNSTMDVRELLSLMDVLSLHIIEQDLTIPDGQIYPLTDNSDISFELSPDKFGERLTYKLEIIPHEHNFC